MSHRLLDTSVLISYWKKQQTKPIQAYKQDEARSWAQDLAELYDTNAIVTPVVIEFLAGVRSSDELRLAKSYLAEFEVIDDGKISPKDWEEAKALAERVPRDGKSRQLGDCLIRAIAGRKSYEVKTLDRRFHS